VCELICSIGHIKLNPTAGTKFSNEYQQSSLLTVARQSIWQ
jgi:hypothetical protein